MKRSHHAVTALCLLIIASLAPATAAQDTLPYNSEREVPAAELIDLLDLSGVLGNIASSTAAVSASQQGPFSANANITQDGRLSCRADGDDVILAAGAGPAASGTCYARVCVNLVTLLQVCQTVSLEFESAACAESGPGVIDPGCSRAAPICQGTGAAAECIGCLSDLDCGNPTGTFGLGVGEVANVTLGLLNQLAGLDLGVPLSTVQVGANANGPFSDEAILESGVTCQIAADGSVDLVADSQIEGASTCYVEVCVPLLDNCLIVDLDILVDGCLLGDQCESVNACDVATNTCVACRDNRGEGDIDSGCSNEAPVCLNSGPEAECVQCQSDVDCTGNLLTLGLGPNRTTVLELSRILAVLNLAPNLLPSNVGVGATVDGPFADEALLDANGALSGCSVDADGNVVLAAAGIEGRAVCHVQVCANLLGGTVESCLSVPIDVTVAACVLDRSCDIDPRCDASNACVNSCLDSAPAGAIDRGCNADEPACGGESCLECQVDVDCTPKRPLLNLDLSDVGTVAAEDVLAALDLDLAVLVDSLQVGATVDGPFDDLTTLDVQADVAQCFINADGDVEVIATTTVYGSVTCYVEACVDLLEAVDTCLVLPIAINVDPCAAAGTCRPPVCNATTNTCTECIDTVAGGIDQGCGATDPACIDDVDGDRCEACEVDADCGGGEVCTPDNTCVPCQDDTVGSTDDGCGTTLPACDEAPLVGVTPVCVECTVDADCDSNLCDEATRTCDNCQDSAAGAGTDAGCTSAEPLCLADAGDGHCEECQDTAAGSGMDLGCDDVEPICLVGADGEGHCNECNTNADCDVGDVCSAAKTCEPCLDTTAGGVDAGCNEPLPACDTTPVGGGDNTCVECTVDQDCTNNLCNETTNRCEECQDTAAGTALDAGCTTGAPLCLPGADGEDHCEECNTDVDCAANEYCSAGKTCETCSDTTQGGVDLGCDEGLPACDVAPLSGTTPICVECTLDADCASNLCDEATRTCQACQDTAAGSGRDDGCSEATPICDVSVPGEETCEACLTDGDCEDDEQCRGGTCQPGEAVIALDDRYDTAFGAALTVATANGVLRNDSGPNGATVQVRLVRATNTATQGSVVLAAEGGFVFTPVAGFQGEATFEYEAFIANGQTDTATVTVDVGDNNAPVGGDDRVETPEDNAALIDVLVNDNDPEGHGLNIDGVGSPIYGDAEVLDDDTVLYTPPSDFSGVDIFSYTFCDVFDGCDTANVVVIITPVNDAPRAADDFVQIDLDATLDIDVLGNDGDPDGDPLTLTRLITPGLVGTATIVSGQVRFVAGDDFKGETSFSYEVCDGAGLCDMATVVVTVGEDVVALAIDAVNDVVTTTMNVVVTFDVLANDLVEGDGDATMQAWSVPSAGQVSASERGQVTYRPSVGFVGTDSFRYTACVAGDCDVATVTITVTEGANAPPIAIDDRVSTLVDVAVIVDVTGNDYDPNGDAVTVTAVGAPLVGTATLRPDGAIDYTPAPGFLGVDVFQVEVNDGNGGSDTSTVTVLVLPGDNNAPVADDDMFTLEVVATEGEPMVTNLDVLANDSDPDGDELVIDVVVQPFHGIARIAADGNIDYQAPLGFNGPDYFTYRVADGRGGFDTASVTVVIGSPNTPPKVVDDVVQTPEETTVAIDVLANDHDVEGALIVTLLTEPSHGALTWVGSAFDYAPALDYDGPDSFTYEACDTHGACGQAEVSITVTPVNDAPVARDDVGMGTAGVALLIDVLANDSDVDGDTLEVGAVGNTNVGTASIQLDGRVLVLAPVGFTGALSFMYDACDAGPLCSRATVTINVSGAEPSAPIATDDQATTEADEGLEVAVLANDSDPDGDTLSIKSVTQPARGSARVVGLAVEYVPDEGFVGVDTFQYVVCDLTNLCDTGRVSMTVIIPVTNEAPIAEDDLLVARAGEVHEVDVLVNDSDPDGDVLRVVTVSQGTQGTATIVNGKVVYTANASARGGDLVTYTACDVWNVCDEAQVTITVAALTLDQFNVAGGACANGGASTFVALALGVLFIAALRLRRRAKEAI